MVGRRSRTCLATTTRWLTQRARRPRADISSCEVLLQRTAAASMLLSARMIARLDRLMRDTRLLVTGRLLTDPSGQVDWLAPGHHSVRSARIGSTRAARRA